MNILNKEIDEQFLNDTYNLFLKVRLAATKWENIR